MAESTEKQASRGRPSLKRGLTWPLRKILFVGLAVVTRGPVGYVLRPCVRVVLRRQTVAGPLRAVLRRLPAPLLNKLRAVALSHGLLHQENALNPDDLSQVCWGDVSQLSPRARSIYQAMIPAHAQNAEVS